MATNKTIPTKKSVDKFVKTTSETRQKEAAQLINSMSKISGKKPTMWGPSIIGFGSKHYKYESGREGDMPELSFSPRKNAITIYFMEGFNLYGKELDKLGKYKNSISCLYINKLEDINYSILEKMLKKSFSLNTKKISKPKTVEEYVNTIPKDAKKKFEQLRAFVKKTAPNAEEVLSYGILGYKVKKKLGSKGGHNWVYIAGWKDHLSMYPLPKDKKLLKLLEPYIKGKGTLWFELDKPLPNELIKKVIISNLVNN